MLLICWPMLIVFMIVIIRLSFIVLFTIALCYYDYVCLFWCTFFNFTFVYDSIIIIFVVCCFFKVSSMLSNVLLVCFFDFFLRCLYLLVSVLCFLPSYMFVLVIYIYIYTYFSTFYISLFMVVFVVAFPSFCFRVTHHFWSLFVFRCFGYVVSPLICLLCLCFIIVLVIILLFDYFYFTLFLLFYFR